MKNKWFIEPYITKQEQKANKALDVVGEVIKSEAKIRVPVDTGNLRGSITTDREHLAVGIGTNVEYAPFIELGTEKSPDGQPFLRPALDDNVEKIQKLFTRLMSK